MALKAVDREKLKAWSLDVEKLEAAIKAEGEVDVELPDLVVMKKEEQEARDNNKVAEGKRIGETEGEKKGKELAAKSLKKKFSIEDETKDIDKVVELVTAKAATGDVGLKEQVGLLLKDKETLQGKVQQLESSLESTSFDTSLISMFPTNRTSDLKDAERLMLAKQDLAFEKVDGKTVVKRNGEILRDSTTQNPVPVDKALTDYFTERKWVGAVGGSGGRGGIDNPSGAGGVGLKKLSQVQAQWVKDNPNGSLVSPEFQSHVETVAKDVPDFDFYN